MGTNKAICKTPLYWFDLAPTLTTCVLTSVSQNLFQLASGSVLSRHNGEIVLKDIFSYPLLINIVAPPDSSNSASSFLPTPFSPLPFRTDDPSTTVSAYFDHSYHRFLLPAPFILDTTISERQLAGGSSYVAPNGKSAGSNGTSNNTFYYVDTAGHTYTRQVNASSNVITFDHQGGNLAPSPVPDQSSRVLPIQAVTKARLPGGRVIGGN